MKCEVMPWRALPGELLLARPVAAQADLHVARRVDVAGLDEPVHRGAVRALDAEHLAPGVGVRVEVHEPDRARGPPRIARMSGSAIEWSPPSTIGTAPAASTVADRVLDRLVRAHRVGGQDRRVAEVDHAQRSRAGASTPASRCAPARAARARGSPAARSACPARRRSARPSARRRSRRPRPRARRGPRCRAGRRTTSGRRSRASRRRRPSGSSDRSCEVSFRPDGQRDGVDERRRSAPEPSEAEVDAAREVRERAGVELGLDGEQAEHRADAPTRRPRAGSSRR